MKLFAITLILATISLIGCKPERYLDQDIATVQHEWSISGLSSKTDTGELRVFSKLGGIESAVFTPTDDETLRLRIEYAANLRQDEFVLIAPNPKGAQDLRVPFEELSNPAMSDLLKQAGIVAP